MSDLDILVDRKFEDYGVAGISNEELFSRVQERFKVKREDLALRREAFKRMYAPVESSRPVEAMNEGMSQNIPGTDYTLRQAARLGFETAVPGTSDVIAGRDALKYAKEGRWGMASLMGASVVPFVGDVASMWGKMGPEMLGAAVGVISKGGKTAENSKKIRLGDPVEGFDTSKVDIPNWDDALEKPEYFARAKHLKVEIKVMTPDEYLDEAVKGLKKSQPFDRNIIEGRLATKNRETGKNIVDEYAERFKRGDKAPMLTLDYSGGDFGQEGLHRALAAKKAGLKEVAVAVRTDVKETKEVGEGGELIEHFTQDGKIVPRMEDGSEPKFLYRVITKKDFERFSKAGKLYPGRHGRIHASGYPQMQYKEPGGSVVLKIKYSDADGWKAKTTLDDIYAITDKEIPMSKVEVIKETE